MVRRMDFLDFSEKGAPMRIQANRDFITDCEKRNNEKIEAGEKITLRTLYTELGFAVPEQFDPLYDLWGWDKKGFRQLYERITYLKPL